MESVDSPTAPDTSNIKHPILFFEGFYGNVSADNIPVSQMEFIDIEVGSSDEEISLSDYDIVRIDEEQQIENTAGEKDGGNSNDEISKTISSPTISTVCNELLPAFKDGIIMPHSFLGRPIKFMKPIVIKNVKLPEIESTSTPRVEIKPGCDMDEIVAKWSPDLECIVCKCFCANFEMLKLHYTHEHPGTRYGVNCCGRTIRGRASYVQHITYRHAKQTKAKVALVIDTKEFDEFIQHYIPTLKCPICSVECSDFSTLRKHFKMQHRNEACSFACCETNFTSTQALVDHIRVHIDPNNFVCVLCEQTFLTKYGHNWHMLHEHYVSKSRIFEDYYHPSVSIRNKSIARIKFKDLDNFIASCRPALQCVICSLRFLSYTSLNNHYLQSHPNDECSVPCCDAQFKTRHQLEEHFHLHNDPRGFECQVCSERFKFRSYLFNHMCSEHPLKTLTTNDNLANHQRTDKEWDQLLDTHRTITQFKAKSNQKLDAVIASCKLKIVCGECNRSLKSLTQLKHHFYFEHPERKFYFKCCNEKHRTYYRIWDHITYHREECDKVDEH